MGRSAHQSPLPNPDDEPLRDVGPEDVEPVLDDATPRCTILGVVVDGRGRPLAERMVMIESSSHPHHDIAAQTDDAGRFTLGGLRPGRYTLVAFSPTGGRTTSTVLVRTGASVRAQLCMPDEEASSF